MDVQRWKKKKEKARLEGNVNNLYVCCKDLADIYFQHEEYDSALLEYREMERISEATANRMDVGRANRMIGEVHCEKAEFDDAVKHQMIHLVISREEHDKVEEQRALATLGRTYFLQAESVMDIRSGVQTEALNKAKKYYIQSLAVCQDLSGVNHKQRMEMITRLFLNIGLVLDCQDQYTEATDYMLKAVSICRKLDLWEDLYRTYSALGASYQKQNEKNHALKTYDLAINVAERLSNKAKLSSEVLLLKADILIDLPDLRGAMQALYKAHKLRPSGHTIRQDIERKLRTVAAMCEYEDKLIDLPADNDYEERKKMYESLGDAASELNNFSLALTYYHLMLESVEKNGNDKKALVDSYVSLAQTYKDNHQYNKALEFFQKELQLEEERSPEACKTLLNIAEVYQQIGRTEDMFEAYEKVKIGAMHSNDLKLLKTVFRLMETAYLDANQITLAEEMKRELNSLITGLPDDSSEDDDEAPRQFGAHICLDDLSDEERNSEGKPKMTRTRHKHKSANLEKRNEKGETPLHTAAIQGNVSLATKLLEQGHRVDVKDYSGWTPLHEACNHGHIEVVRVLLHHKASINDRGGPHCDGVTPLLDAASNGSLDVMELLIVHGASPLMRTNSGDSVINCLSEWRKRRMGELGVDLDQITLAQYESVYHNLQQALEKAGQKPSKMTTPEKRVSSPRRECDKSRHERSPIPLRNQLDINIRRQKKNSIESVRQMDVRSNDGAAFDYENTMQALRFRTKHDKIPSSKSKLSMPALLPIEESVGDDWLENDMDMLRPNKKRRTGEFIGEPLRRSTVSTMVPVSPPSSPIIDSEEILEEPHERIEVDTSDSSQDIPMISQPIRNVHSDQPSTSGGFSNRLKEMNATRRMQISLMATGVTKQKVVKNSPPRLEHGFPSDQEAFSVKTSSRSRNSITCVKVEIEGKLLVVPIKDNDISKVTISWLSEEAANRYRSLEGVEPVLRLEMDDGALLMGSDPVSIVLDLPMVRGRVLSWKFVALTAMYREACQNSNGDWNNELSEILEVCQATAEISLDDMYLNRPELIPILRALSHHIPLQTFSLAGNNISDSFIQEVADCVAKLPRLKCLDLSNTNITARGLQIFADTITKSEGLQALEKLKLGYNPLGDCLTPLSQLLNCIRGLRQLILPDIELTSSFFSSYTQFSLDCVEVLDLSMNEIGSEALIDILGSLNARTIVDLRLARTSESTIREVGFYLSHHAPPALRRIDLSYCPAQPMDIDQFIQGTRLCRQLEKVTLDGVSCSGLNELLDLPIKELSLCGANFTSVVVLPEQMKELTVTSCVTQPWPARRGPFGLFASAT